MTEGKRDFCLALESYSLNDTSKVPTICCPILLWQQHPPQMLHFFARQKNVTSVQEKYNNFTDYTEYTGIWMLLYISTILSTAILVTVGKTRSSANPSLTIDPEYFPSL